MAPFPADPNARPDLSAYLSLFAVTALWGSTFLFTDIALGGFTAGEVSMGRLLLGSATQMIPLFLFRRFVPMPSRYWLWLLVLGVVGYAAPLLAIAWAQQYVSSSLAAIFLSAMPLFILLLSRLFLGERISARKWVGFFIGLGGLFILAAPADMSELTSTVILPELAMLIACVMLASSTLIVRKVPAAPVGQTTAFALLIGGVCLLPFGMHRAIGAALGQLPAVADAPPTATPIFALAFLGIALSGIGQAIRIGTIQKYGPVFFSIAGYLIPVWATILGVIILGEDFSLRKPVAIAIIFTGLLLAQTATSGARA